MNKADKEKVLESLHGIFKDAKSAFLVSYRGLKVVDDTELRRQIKKTNSCDYRVVKNTLALRAAKETMFERLSDHFQGPVAVAYSVKDDAAALAKLLIDFAKTHPTINFKAAVIEGKVIPAEQIPEIAKLPSREELVSKLLFMLNSPVARLASVLNAPLRDFVSVLKQIQK